MLFVLLSLAASVGGNYDPGYDDPDYPYAPDYPDDPYPPDDPGDDPDDGPGGGTGISGGGGFLNKFFDLFSGYDTRDWANLIWYIVIALICIQVVWMVLVLLCIFLSKQKTVGFPKSEAEAD